MEARATQPEHDQRTSDATLAWETFSTPLGTMIGVAHTTGLVLLEFAEPEAREECLARGAALIRAQGTAHDTNSNTPHALHAPSAILQATRDELARYFESPRAPFRVPLAPIGTPFQQRAWHALLAIPPGSTRTYAQQAVTIGSHQAVRAVARANAQNPRAVIVPCHRVIGSDGSLTGFAAGLHRKQWLLEHEGAGAGATLFVKG